MNSLFLSYVLYYVSLLSSHDVLLRVTINSAEKLESFFGAMITHVAEEGYFRCAYKTLNNQKKA